MTIAVVIHECSPGVPVILRLQQAGFARHIGESPVAVVVVKNVPAVISDEKVQVAVVVVIPDAHSLTPTMPHQSRFFGNVSKGSVAVVPIQMVSRLLAFGKGLQPPTVDHE